MREIRRAPDFGQTLTSGADGKSSTNALGNVHNEVRLDLLVSDAKQVAQTITQQIILPYLQINVDPNIAAHRVPYFEFDTKKYEDLSVFADAIPKLVAVCVQVPERWTRDKLGIPEAQEGEAILKAVQTDFNPDSKMPEKPTALSAHVVGCQCAGCLGNGKRVALSAKTDKDKTEQDLLDERGRILVLTITPFCLMCFIIPTRLSRTAIIIFGFTN